MEKDEARRRMVCRRVFWSYNRVWLESRLFVMALFLAVGVYCCVRDGGGGGFWPGSIALTACAAFFFLPPSVPRFVFRGWMDVRKNRVSAAEIIIQACDESTGYAMLNEYSGDRLARQERYSLEGVMLSRTNFEYDDSGLLSRASFLTPGADTSVTILYTNGPVYIPDAEA